MLFQINTNYFMMTEYCGGRVTLTFLTMIQVEGLVS